MLRLILVSPILVLFAACATPPREYTDPRPVPTAEQLADFGNVGVAAAGLAAPREPIAPQSLSNLEKGQVTAAGGLLGAGTGAVMGLACGPLAIFCVPAFAAAGGAAGLGAGIASSVQYGTPEEINNADITLRNALLSVDVEDRIVDGVLTRASRRGTRKVDRLEYEVETRTWESPPDGGEIDTRMLIAAPRVSLVALDDRQRADPPVRLEIVVQGQIFQDGRESPEFERRWIYDSQVRGYFEWAENQGVLVITELNRAVDVLSKQVTADFLEGGYATAERLPVNLPGGARVAALKGRETGESSSRTLRVAVFPFATGANASSFAEQELKDHLHRFIAQQRELELIYSAYDDDFDQSKIGPATTFWDGGYTSKSPNEAAIYNAADAMNADLVLTSFHKKRVAGWYSAENYKFELYLFDVRKKRMYRGSGDERSVRERLESMFRLLDIEGDAP